ncbi:MAG TPA: LysR family transcriptional regulator [Casimicrobiaceae bacterium]|nr:LysR family transcriptional regulator [Casimicrobiaceae bacterium]
MLDLKSLKVFLTVADAASMTAAAKRLGLSQSAVSQAIRQLEESLGAVLIDRERRPLALTAAGAALRQRGVQLVAEAETLYKAVREQAGGEAQMLRIGMVDSFAATVGPPLIKRLLTSTVHLHVASGLSADLGARLLERRLDMIVTAEPPESATMLERHRLLDETYVLLLPRSLAGMQAKWTLDQLATHAPLVRFNADSQIGVQIERYLVASGVVPPHRLEIDTADSLVAMVVGGIGWALITPLCLLQARAMAQAVVALPLPDAPLRRELTLLARHGEYGDLPARIARDAADIFRAECLPQLARIAPWLAAERYL